LALFNCPHVPVTEAANFLLAAADTAMPAGAVTACAITDFIGSSYTDEHALGIQSLENFICVKIPTV